jgi:hypothetical protein
MINEPEFSLLMPICSFAGEIHCSRNVKDAPKGDDSAHTTITTYLVVHLVILGVSKVMPPTEKQRIHVKKGTNYDF